MKTVNQKKKKVKTEGHANRKREIQENIKKGKKTGIQQERDKTIQEGMKIAGNT